MNHGDMIQLLHANDFESEDLLALQAPAATGWRNTAYAITPRIIFSLREQM